VSANVNAYLSLITSEHKRWPKYMAFIAALCQPSVDQQNLLQQFPSLFDVDLAVGDQEDKIGAWVGVSRNLTQEIMGSSTLNDSDYRILLKLFIAMNSWDGTIPGIYEIWNAILAPTVGGLLVQDNEDMNMYVVLLDPPTNLVILAILSQGYFLMRPAGVLIAGYFEASVVGEPVFGCDAENATIAGPDVGYFVAPL